MDISNGRRDCTPKRIAIVGPESSGKTTLTKELSIHYNTACVVEYARQYLEQKKEGYAKKELDIMLHQQLINEEAALKEAGPYLFCDTNALSFFVWSMFKYGNCSNYISAQLQRMNYDHYLLCRPDLSYEKDSLRESPSQLDRQRIFDMHLNVLKKKKLPFKIVERMGHHRRKKVISFLQTQFPA